MSADDALLFIHETVQHARSSEWSRERCIRWIRDHGTEMQVHVLDFHALPALDEFESRQERARPARHGISY